MQVEEGGFLFFFRPKKKIRQGQVWRFSENKRLDIVLYTANKLKHQSKQPILDGIHQRLNALPSFGYEPTCTQSMKTHVAFTILVFLPSVDPHSFLLVVSYLNLSFHSLTTSFDNTHTHTHTHKAHKTRAQKLIFNPTRHLKKFD